MRSRYITIIITGALSIVLCLPALGVAVPAEATMATQSVVSSEVTQATLNADQASVTATDTFSYTIRVWPARGADSISARFELSDLQSQRIFQRTKYWTFTTNSGTNNGTVAQAEPSPNPDGSYSYTFTRNLTDLNLKPGDYSVSCTIHTSAPKGASTQHLTSHLFVYDPAGARAPAVLVLRLGAPPLRLTSGVFASDPATGTARVRTEELSQLSNWVLAHPSAQLTLAPSPLLIRELADIAAGCHYINSKGATVALPSGSPTARFVEHALDDLRAALATGRLQLAWQGYSDPDVSALLGHQLIGDVTAQYQQGATMLESVLGVKPLPVTAPFGGSDVVQASKQLAPLGIKRILPASYNKVSQSLETSTLVTAQARLFGQRGQKKATAVVVGLPTSEATARALLERVEALQDCAWIKFSASDTTELRAPTDNPGVRQQSFETASRDFTPVYQARQAALGLVSAVGAKDANARKATQFSLIAENAFGPQPASKLVPTKAPVTMTASAVPTAAASTVTTPTPTPATQGIESYTAATLRVVRKAFAPLSLKAHPVTLAGNSGEAPITVADSSGTQTQVHLEFSSASNRMKVEPLTSPLLTVAGNEAIFSPKVTLRTVGSSDLHVRLMAGAYVISEDSVTISGSYLDIIGIVVIVVLVGAGLVLYIWRHSKRVQEGGSRVR